MISAPRARFLFFGAGALYLGPIDDNRPHSHQAEQFVWALTTPFIYRDSSFTTTSRFVTISPRTTHAVESPNAAVLTLLVDQNAPFTFVADDDFSAIIVPLLSKGAYEEAYAHLGRYMHLKVPQIPRDQRVAKALEYIHALDIKKVSLAELAEQCQLSEGRFEHLFSASMGVPLRRYLLWVKLLRAVELLLEGASLTTAAHEADFSDSAHFSRTFRAMFGLAPSMLFKRSGFVQACSLPKALDFF